MGLVPAIDVLPAETAQERHGCRNNPRIKSGDGHDAGEVLDLIAMRFELSQSSPGF
jgi:hypothetical protein